MSHEYDNISRIELIDHTKSVEEGGGRCFVKYEEGLKVEILLQDNDRTLKVIISKK